MKKLGLIGGVGPESTIKYYRLIIEAFQKELNTKEYPEFLIESIDMTKMLSYVFNNELDKLVDFLCQRIYVLEKAGVDFVAVASNTPHIVIDELVNRTQIPIISIIDETCNAVKEKSITKVGLFGTKSTMTAGFYQQKANEFGIGIIVPETGDLDFIHDRYMNELVFSNINPETKNQLKQIANQLKENHFIEGLILGGTELSLILDQSDFDDLHVFDSTKIHVDSLVLNMIG